jgi:hypothetical protein
MIRIFICVFSLFAFSATALSENSNTDIKIQQSIEKTNVLIFPNPTAGLVTVRITYDAKNVSMRLFAQNGRCVLNKNLQAPADNLLDIRGLDAGVYVYQIFENYKKIDAGKLILSK